MSETSVKDGLYDFMVIKDSDSYRVKSFHTEAEVVVDHLLEGFDYEAFKELVDEFTANDYSGRFTLRIPKTLHGRLAVEAKARGISLNALCLEKLSV